MDRFDISSRKKKITKKEKIHLFFLIIIYLSLELIVSGINKNQVQIEVMGAVLTPSIISGVITSFCIAVGIMMTQVHWHYGGIIAYFLFCLNLFLVFVSIFISHHPDSLPGFFFVCSGFLINTILIKNLRLVETKNLLTEKLAITDSVTGLYNRRGITKYMEDLVNEKKPFYVLFLDLDNFKSLNDTFGHSFGDLMLRVIGDRWESIPKPDGLIGRNGGDEFLIVIPYDFKFDVEGFAKECIKKALEPVYLDEGKTFTTSASIGIASYPENGLTADELLIKADFAMYGSKHRGKNCYTISVNE